MRHDDRWPVVRLGHRAFEPGAIRTVLFESVRWFKTPVAVPDQFVIVHGILGGDHGPSRFPIQFVVGPQGAAEKAHATDDCA